MDLKIDPLTGDLYVSEAGDLAAVTGREAIAQHARVRMQHFLGEWFLDEREGMPLFERVFVHSPDIPAVSESFRRTIAETPGIASVRDLALDFDRQTRTLNVVGSAVTTDGETIEAADFATPFVIAEADTDPALT